MERLKCRGNSISQYAIIIALVALGLVPVFYILGSNITAYFDTFYKYLGGNGQDVAVSTTPDASQVDDNSSQTGDSSANTTGDSNSPSMNCENFLCNIDVGPYTLQGVPQNFNDLVETSGASGGTDQLVSLIEQIASQMDAQGMSEESARVQKLASIGHNLASMQRILEDYVTTCDGNLDCIDNKLSIPLQIPEGYDTGGITFPEGSSYWDLCESLFDVGRARNMKDNDPTAYQKAITDYNVAYHFVEQFDTVMTSPGIDDTTKSVLQELYWSIGVIAEDFDNNINFLSESSTSAYYDPITGKEKGMEPPEDPLGSFASYNASTITHLDSSLMCAAGDHEDTGTQCH
jgi:hypothetical protein